MVLLVLLVLLAFVAFGFVCTVWAARGGPRWVRIVSSVTVGLAEVVGSLTKSSRRSGNGSNSSGDGD
ncbi:MULTISPECIES: hypothetical protein [unclassified Streptomyces]|uniref:hypothetical protein n=1 Tax=unclassified Streptomyces TaxID=2593676 RepID=UPI00278BB4D1|nr:MULTISPECIES: hypothetical protein [unclassified Streptomyces]